MGFVGRVNATGFGGIVGIVGMVGFAGSVGFEVWMLDGLSW